MNLKTGVWTQLTFDGFNAFPVWMRNGQAVIFNSIRKNGPGLYRKKWTAAPMRKSLVLRVR